MEVVATRQRRRRRRPGAGKQTLNAQAMGHRTAQCSKFTVVGLPGRPGLSNDRDRSAPHGVTLQLWRLLLLLLRSVGVGVAALLLESLDSFERRSFHPARDVQITTVINKNERKALLRYYWMKAMRLRSVAASPVSRPSESESESESASESESESAHRI